MPRDKQNDEPHVGGGQSWPNLSFAIELTRLLSHLLLPVLLAQSRSIIIPFITSTPYADTTPITAKMPTQMAKRLHGKTILITGASSGIGRSTAFEFARTSPESLKLVLTARRIDTLKQVAEEIVKEVGNGVQVHPVQLDVSKPDEIRSFLEKLPAEFKEIDVLVNNAYVPDFSPDGVCCTDSG